MDRLIKGIRQFGDLDFHHHKDLFQRISVTQNPHTLFIGCSDSRVVPDLITKSMPGDLFVVRNIANIVPPFRKSGEFYSTTSAIEYAVKILRVKNIVVCGHSNCGGCRALSLPDEDTQDIPHTMKWLELAKQAKRIVKKKTDKNISPDEFDCMVEEENIIEQMNHLFTYPFIAEKYKKGALQVFGWYYDILTGKVLNYNRESQIFEKIS